MFETKQLRTITKSQCRRPGGSPCSSSRPLTVLGEENCLYGDVKDDEKSLVTRLCSLTLQLLDNLERL